MDAKSVLVNALNSYIYDISSDYKGDCTALLKQIKTCRDYANTNEVTVGWIKSHYMIILPAIKSSREFLKFLIEDADRNKDEDKLAKLRAENNILWSYSALLKPYQRFIP